jgi:alpha-tubulin suppressor-like RCC1 family protein
MSTSCSRQRTPGDVRGPAARLLPALGVGVLVASGMTLGLNPTQAAERIRRAEGKAHVLQVKPDGTVWASGDNRFGQLGDGTTSTRSSGVQVVGLTNVVAVAAGEGHSLALRKDGILWAWGDNERGQLGNNTRENRTQPVKVMLINNVAWIKCGPNYSKAGKTDGSIWRWGAQDSSDLENDALIPRPLRGPTDDPAPDDGGGR